VVEREVVSTQPTGKGERVMKHDRTKRGVVPWVLATAVVVGFATTGCQGGGEGEEASAQPEPTFVDRRIEALSAELELTDDQAQRLRTVRDVVHERRDAFRAERDATIEARLAELEAGELDAEAIHEHIDTKIAELRETAHRIADELIALAESMDDAQRARAAAKIRTIHERMAAFHERMENAGDHGAILAHVRERLCAADGDALGPWTWLEGDGPQEE
jgi:uncharacterized coiled-coil protein SlyX